jgi:hypothetical protein
MGRSTPLYSTIYWILVVVVWELRPNQAFTMVRPAASPQLPTNKRGIPAGAATDTLPFFRYGAGATILQRGRRDDDDNEEELVPVRRQRSGRKPYYEDDVDEPVVEEQYYNEDNRKGPAAGRTYEREDYYDDDDDEDELNDDDEVEDFDDALAYLDEVLDEWEPTEHKLFGNEIVPNVLLDNVDPDGAADRFPELARDPRFWFDLVLLIMFLDFLSLAGPQDALPLLPSLFD